MGGVSYNALRKYNGLRKLKCVA